MTGTSDRFLGPLFRAIRVRKGRKAIERLRAAISGLPPDMDPEAVVDFLFSRTAEAMVPWQIEEEFLELVRLVARRRPRTLLEIGTADGGSLFAHARVAAPDAVIISIDLPEGPFGGGYPPWRIPLYRSFALPEQQLELLRVDSHDPSTADRLAEILRDTKIDYAFIDGDHTYDGVRMDFELCRRFAAEDAVIVFHDIVGQPNREYTAEAGPSAHAPWAVHDFWTEISRRHVHEEFVRDREQEGYGIGVLYLADDPVPDP